MAEEAELPESGEANVGVDPTATALAMAGASRAEANVFLKKQGALIDKQSHHLDEQLKRLKMGVFSDRLTIILKLLTGLIGIAVACFVGVVVWDAAHADGLIVESFSVPPDLAARGLTGEVMATQLLDRILAMDGSINSNRAPKSYANSWSREDLKVEIPETGLSLGELDNFLRQKLGHETHVTGEIVRTDTGLDLTARAGANGAGSVTGSEAQLDTLIQSLAESVYRQTQPYRYGIYVLNHDRNAEAVTVFKALAETGPAAERAWGYNGWQNAVTDSESIDFQLDLLKRAAALAPDVEIVRNNMASTENSKGQSERVLGDLQKAQALLARPDHGQVRDDSILGQQKAQQTNVDGLLGAWADAAQDQIEAIRSGFNNTAYSRSTLVAIDQIHAHDLAGARATLADPEAIGRGGASGAVEVRDIQTRMLMDSEAQDWPDVLAQDQATVALLAKYPARKVAALTETDPFVAYAQGKLGDFKGAEARIAATPVDCYPCLIARAQIADLGGDRARADDWFGRAVAAGPSLPTANAEWGKVLLARGQSDDAIEKFTLANKKGPHFADPLEMWGEALMAKNQSHLALAKFAEAEKYAPNWGRLHLKWGEALFYAGNKTDAAKEFTKAATLDLSAADKSELAGMNHG